MAPARLGWIYVPVIIAGLGRGGLNYIPWNTYNYMADVDEIVTGRRREGAFAGVMTFVRKTMQAAAVMGVGLILQAGGFVSGATVQSPQAVTTILVVMTAGTLALLAFGYLVSLRFKLDRNTHAVLMAEIQRFKQHRARSRRRRIARSSRIFRAGPMIDFGDAARRHLRRRARDAAKPRDLHEPSVGCAIRRAKPWLRRSSR